jgi:hypothetical protein
MGWTRSKSSNTGKHSETETFAGANLPAPWGTNTSSTGKVQTDIDGERTLVTDQSGKQRISKTNALGRLLFTKFFSMSLVRIAVILVIVK